MYEVIVVARQLYKTLQIKQIKKLPPPSKVGVPTSKVALPTY